MTYSPFRILLVVLLIAVNGFFAGAEVALLSVRHSRLRQMAEEGQAGAQAALSLLSNPGRLLSVTQVGVTLASLGLGWAGENTLYRILIGLFHPVTTPLTAKFLHGASLAISFLVISYFHVVLGEVVPKNLAIAKADRLAVLVAPALLVFYRLSHRRSWWSSSARRGAITRALRAEGRGPRRRPFGRGTEADRQLQPRPGLPAGGPGGHDPPRARPGRRLGARDHGAAQRHRLHSGRTPRSTRCCDTMIEKRHSRLPVYEGAPEKIVGILHYKDLLPVWEERRRAIRAGRPSRAFRIARLLRPHLVVPETKPLSQMLEEFRTGQFAHGHGGGRVRHHRRDADRGGRAGAAGGPHRGRARREERAAAFPKPRRWNWTAPRASATWKPSSASRFPPTPASRRWRASCSSAWARFPSAGESVEYEGRRYTVLEMDRNRIARVRIEKLPEPPAPAPG